MFIRKNDSDPAEALGWQILAAQDLGEAIHQALAHARAIHLAAHPDKPEMAIAFGHYCAQQLKGAAARIAARHEFFAGMQIGGSA
jgi:hypothetical protein